jgi:hypothetical protein
MDSITKDNLMQLMEEPEGPCVSIFMPTHRAGRDIKQDPIRFKNLLDEAEKRLLETGLRSGEVNELLEKAEKLVQDSLFWRHQSDGLAVFISLRTFSFYRLPDSMAEAVVVSDSFHILPLLPFLNNDGGFYILAISQNAVRLYAATRFSIVEVSLEGIPGSLAEVLKYDDREKQIQFHTPGRKGIRPAIYHGAGEDDVKENIRRYFRSVDKGLNKLLTDPWAPLVFAGVDYLFPIYREVNTYPFLENEGIPGSPESLKEEELQARSWAIVRPLFQEVRRRAIDLYQQLAAAGSKKVSSDLDRLVSASLHGVVETLFVVNAAKLRNRENTVNLVLLDLAVRHTLRNGGAVYVVDPEEAPWGSAAAIFRYQFDGHQSAP